MKKLILIIPFIIVGCVSPEQQSRNAQIMQGIYSHQQAQEAQNVAAYQQNLENSQRQQMIDIQRRQLNKIEGPKTYTVTDQHGRMRTYTVKENVFDLGSPGGR